MLTDKRCSKYVFIKERAYILYYLELLPSPKYIPDINNVPLLDTRINLYVCFCSNISISLKYVIFI